MPATNFAAHKFLDHATGNTDIGTMPTSLYVMFHIGDPGADAANNPAAETTRQAITFGTSAAARAISATVLPSWTNVSTTEVYSHFSLWDSATVGNPWWQGALTSTISVTAGDDVDLTAGTLSFT